MAKQKTKQESPQKELHKKPTAEELDEKIKESQEKLDALEEPTIEPEEEIPPTTEPEEPEEQEEPEETEVEEDTTDYKEKFSESSREAQVLSAKNKKVNEAIDKAMQVSDPTEEELTAEYSDWDVMDDSQKKMAKDVLVSKKRMEALAEATREFKDIDAWNEKVDGFVEDPKTVVSHPDLEGKAEEFKIFATKPTRRGVELDDLVSAFLYDASKQAPVKKKKQMFETGTGGPSEKPKPADDKISVEEGRRLRKIDYKKWREMLTAGKIRDEIESSS